MIAAPAIAGPASVVEFNGFSARVMLSSTSTPPAQSDIEHADKAAAVACESNGKTASFQRRDKVSSFTYSLFYVCL